jgi:predicted alpha/beta superfamily hydrolase
LGEGRVLHVALPDGYDEGDVAYPLILCLDAQWMFGTLCDSSLNLGLARLMPRAVILGVGWQESTAKGTLRLRGEAYTPTVGEFPERVAPRSLGQQSSGGAPRFLSSLVDDVLPLSHERYRLRADDRTFVGHSLSALFGLYTLFNRPETFQRYLLASPSIWWDDRVILQAESAFAERATDLAARVFVSVGADEEQPGFFPMVQNARLLVSQLEGRHYPSLQLTMTLLEGEIHYSTIPAAISRGLRALFHD